MSRTYLPPIVALLLIAFTGAVYGMWPFEGIWPFAREQVDMRPAAERLQTIPAVIGDWHATELPFDERQLVLAEAVGYVSRRYVKQADGNEVAAVNVLMLCGPTGPMAVHPPTVCFTSVGWKQALPEVTRAVFVKGQAEPEDLLETEFTMRDATQSHRMRTLWGWSGNGRWQAPGNPRVKFAGFPFLYKLYVTEALPPDDEWTITSEDSTDKSSEPANSESPPAQPAVEFLEVFLPAATKALFDVNGRRD